MARTSDVDDPSYRADLEAAEELLDSGEYSDCVRRSMSEAITYFEYALVSAVRGQQPQS